MARQAVFAPLKVSGRVWHVAQARRDLSTPAAFKIIYVRRSNHPPSTPTRQLHVSIHAHRLTQHVNAVALTLVHRPPSQLSMASHSRTVFASTMSTICFKEMRAPRMPSDAPRAVNPCADDTHLALASASSRARCHLTHPVCL